MRSTAHSCINGVAIIRVIIRRLNARNDAHVAIIKAKRNRCKKPAATPSRLALSRHARSFRISDWFENIARTRTSRYQLKDTTLSTHLCSRRPAWSPPDGTNDTVGACAVAWSGTRDTAVQIRSEKTKGLITICVSADSTDRGRRRRPFFLTADFFVDQSEPREPSERLASFKAGNYKWGACSMLALERPDARKKVADCER